MEGLMVGFWVGKQSVSQSISSIYPDITDSFISVVNHDRSLKYMFVCVGELTFKTQKMLTVNGVITRRAEVPRYS